MATNDGNTERRAKVIVPLVATFFAFLASLLSGYLVYYTNEKTETIKTKLAEIQASQFERDSTRQYVGLVYSDLTSKDPARQRVALSLLEILEPQAALKLLAWARNANIIFAENKDESKVVERKLESLQENARFKVFLHTGKVESRPVPEVDAIKKTILARGLSILGADEKSDRYGPGVDYFHEKDKAGAEQLARALSDLLPAGANAIPARPQSGQHPPGVLGVWF